MAARQERIVIVGGGPAGSSCAIHLAQAGLRPLIVEKDRFPRFHIGESLTGESGNLLREMGLERAMLAMDNPVKHGVHIYGPSGRHWFWFPVKRRDPTSGLQDTFTWQVRRSTFDGLLLDRAQEAGATLLCGKAVAPATDSRAIRAVAVSTADGATTRECDLLVDASGQTTFLATHRLAGPKHRGGYDRQVAIYGHFTGAVRDDGDGWGNTLLFFREAGLWSWFIPIDRQVTSIGFVVPGERYQAAAQSRHDYLVGQLREFNPELARRAGQAELVSEAHASSNYSYRLERFTGPNWLCVGDAHRFIDPLFSFGVNVALAEGKAAAQAVVRQLDHPTGSDQPFTDYERWAESGLEVCQTVLDGFTSHNLAFGLIHRQHGDDFIDLLAGRVFDDPDYQGLLLLREAIAGRVREAEGVSANEGR